MDDQLNVPLEDAELLAPALGLTEQAVERLDGVGVDAQQTVYLGLGQTGVGLAGGDDQVGGQLDLGEELRILEGDIQLVIHEDAPSGPH